MKILSLDHVQLAMPPGEEDRARAFYRDVLGMTETLKPECLAGRGGCWFSSGSTHIHLGVEVDFRPALKAHPALVVEGLDEILAGCKKAGLPSKPDASIDGRRRVHVFDFFGNRIELIESA
ncbi:MAG TPA: VOC family protein [Candidatus Acidoferrum sp.]|nr:VOC family protein [Candidatus Acidoferrum sp.]